jgi:O-antigen/teichoic acid export membrane protein
MRNASESCVWKWRTSLRRLLPWANKGSFAVLDQGLVSGANFVISIWLARWLLPEQYGAFAVAFGIYMLLRLVYQSLVLEPMTVFGASLFRSNLRGYLRSLAWIHCSLSAAICVALFISLAAVHRMGAGAEVAGALVGVTFASPCLLMFALARRVFYVELLPAEAAAGAFLYAAFVLAGLYIVSRRVSLSPLIAFLLMGMGALLAGIVMICRLRSSLSSTGPAPVFRETWRRHWRYGRWALASCVASWIPSYVYYPLLSSFAGVAQSGQLKALMNLTLPFEQTKEVLCMLALPYAAGVIERQSKSATRVLAGKLTLVTVAGAIGYWSILIILNQPVFRLLYSGRYLEIAYLLPLLAIGQIFWSAAAGPAVALRAMESPGSVFVAFACATCISLVVGVPATWFFGLRGSIWGSNIADLLSLVFVLVLLRRNIATRNSVESISPNDWLGPITDEGV